MKAQKSFIKHIVAAMVTTLLLQGCGGNPGGTAENQSTQGNAELVQGNEEFFIDVEPGADTQAQTDRQEPSLRKRFVRVNFGLLKRVLLSTSHTPSLPATLRLNLFEDKTIEVQLVSIERNSDSNIVATGKIIGDEDSAVSLVINNGVMVANLSYGSHEESFELRYAANGIHEVRIPDDSRSDEQECDPVVAEKEEGDEPMIDDDIASPQSTPVIDMLVAYTPKARTYQGGTDAIKALIQMGIADTNQAFIDSGVNLRVRLVGTIETRQNESSSMSSDLYALRSKTDTRFNEVHAERTRLGADQVTLVAAYSGISTAAGIGYVYSTAASAFTVVKAYYFRQFTFSHELGHNVGLNHSDGYQNTAGRFRTIIAYGTYPRVRRFSNPNLTYNGYRTGTTSQNEAKILNASGGRTAGLLAMSIPLNTL